MEIRRGTAEKISKIEREIQELEVKKDFTYLSDKINTVSTEFKKKYSITAKKVLILGKNELDLLYKSYDFFGRTLGEDSMTDGFITSVWGMDIYTSDVDSFVGIFGKANNIIFVEDE
jgi:hypothetical protein